MTTQVNDIAIDDAVADGVDVIIDFAARPTNPVRPQARRVGGPKVFVLAQAADLRGGHFDLVAPDVGRLVVVEVDRHTDSLWFEIADAAEFLGVSQNTLRTWAEQGKIPVRVNPANVYRLFRQKDLALV